MQTNKQISSPEQTNTTPEDETPTSQKPTASKPITNWLLVVLVILLFGTTGLFAYKYFQLRRQLFKAQSTPPDKIIKISPSPTLTSAPQQIKSTESNLIAGEINNGMQTITNQLFGYSLSVPSNWKVYYISSYNKLSNEEAPTNIRFYYYDYEGPFEYPEWEISIDASNDLGITKPIDQWFSAEGNKFNEYYSLTRTNIANYSGYKMIPHNSGPREGPPDPTVYIIEHNEIIYTISTGVSESKNNVYKFEQQYEQILSTFKFTN